MPFFDILDLGFGRGKLSRHNKYPQPQRLNIAKMKIK